MTQPSIDTNDKIDCTGHLLAIQDSLDILGGKWKIKILMTLLFKKQRFNEMLVQVEGITPKMLSQELKDLETNELVKRTVFDTRPITVEYEITEYGRSIENVIEELHRWGINHRERVLKAMRK